MDEKTLRLLIRMLLRKGRLPFASASKVSGSPATGEVCAACGMVIKDRQLVMDVVPRTAKGKEPIQFHVLCFELWNDERRTPRERDRVTDVPKATVDTVGGNHDLLGDLESALPDELPTPHVKATTGEDGSHHDSRVLPRRAGGRTV